MNNYKKQLRSSEPSPNGEGFIFIEMKVILTNEQFKRLHEQTDEPKRKRRTSAEIEKEREEWDRNYREKLHQVKNKIQEIIDNSIIPEFNNEPRKIKILSSEIDDIVLNVGGNLANIYPKIVFSPTNEEVQKDFVKNGFFPYILLAPFYNLLRERLQYVFDKRRIGVSQENINYEIIPFKK